VIVLSQILRITSERTAAGPGFMGSRLRSCSGRSQCKSVPTYPPELFVYFDNPLDLQKVVANNEARNGRTLEATRPTGKCWSRMLAWATALPSSTMSGISTAVQLGPPCPTTSTPTGTPSRLPMPSLNRSHTSKETCVWYVSGILDRDLHLVSIA